MRANAPPRSRHCELSTFVPLSHSLVVRSVLIAIAVSAAGTTVPVAAESPYLAKTVQDLPVVTAPLPPAEYFRARQRALTLDGPRHLDEALPLWQSLVASFPLDGDNWWHLALTHYQRHEYTAAAGAFDQALQLGAGQTGRLLYQQASCEAALGHDAQAFALLDRALAARWAERFVLGLNAQWKHLRDSPELLSRLAPATEKADRVAGWRGDLRFLGSEARRLHANLFHATTSAAFDAAIERLDGRLSELDDEQVYFELQRIVAMINDGHSNLPPVAKRFTVRQLPLRMYWFDDGLFVIDSDADYTRWIGARVVHFGTTPTPDACRRVAELIGADNPMDLRARVPGQLSLPGSLELTGICPPGKNIELEFEAPDGTRERATIAPREFRSRGRWPSSRLAADAGAGAFVAAHAQGNWYAELRDSPTPAVPHYLRHNDRMFWFEDLAERPGTVFVQFNGVGDAPDETLAAFAQRLHQHLGQTQATTLIVDVRHNGGGNTYLNVALLRTMVAFEMARPTHRLFTILGRHTFSAAQNFVTDVDRLTNSVFVGEPSGSRPNFYGESTPVLLPYSGLRGTISSLLWQHSYPTDDRLWIAPEVPVRLSSVDYFLNRDPALAAILELVPAP